MQALIGPLDKLLGEGAYSWVYSLKNTPHAIKISKNLDQLMIAEYQIAQTLSKKHPSLFPQVLSKEQYFFEQGLFGLQDGLNKERLAQSCLVMERLGISLEQFMNLRGNINVQTIIRIGQQLLSQISVLIQYGISHNDIKPANVLFGLAQKRSKVYLIDYGFAFIKNDNRIQNHTFRGNLPFSSTYRLQTNNFSAKNDLESFIYLMLWVLRDGNLPWQQLSQGSFSRKAQQIIQKRNNFIQSTLKYTKDSLNKRDILIYQLVSILSFLQTNAEIVSVENLLQKLNSLF